MAIGDISPAEWKTGVDGSTGRTIKQLTSAAAKVEETKGRPEGDQQRRADTHHMDDLINRTVGTSHGKVSSEFPAKISTTRTTESTILCFNKTVGMDSKA